VRSKTQQIVPKKFQDYFYSLPTIEQAGFFLWPSLASDNIDIREKELFKILKPSGCILFKRNFQTLAQSRKLITNLKKYAAKKKSNYRMPFIISIDEEGGRVSRLPLPFPRGKPALEFADNHDLTGLEGQLLHQIFIAKSIGINCILSPVADILSEPNNPVIGDRCFGRDAQTVTKFATFANHILMQENIFSCAKHFPGHGNTKTDSHKELSVSDVRLEQLKQREWIPFQKLIQDNIPFIISAHVIVPSLDPKNPATLSNIILTKYLRNDLNFKGIILSDDLRMNAIAEHYNLKRKIESSITESSDVSNQEDDNFLKLASIDALLAGCDILLSCQSITREAKIAYAIAEKMENDKIFHKLMLEKAWNIFLNLTKKQN